MILLDTHALLWMSEGNRQRFGPATRKLADRALARNEALVAAITFWEIALLVSKSRISLDQSPAAFRLFMVARGLREIPLTGAITVAAAEL